MTFTEWRHRHPEKWARAEGIVTHSQYRTLKFLDAQIHLTREREYGICPPETQEVRWLRTCVTVFLFVTGHLAFPTDERSVMWVKNQRRAHLCDYQVASLMQIPGWQWQPRRLSWDQRVAELNNFRDEYGREPRIRSGWETERALAHWYMRQHRAAQAGKLTPNQAALLEGEPGQPTAELVRAIPAFPRSYDRWFKEFWAEARACGRNC